MPFDTSYEYLNAKLHGMKSAMFEGWRLHDLLRAHDLAELGKALFPGQEITSTSAFDIERGLTQAYFADLDKVCCNLGEAAAHFFEGFLRKVDTENLKLVVRHWFTHRQTGRAELEAVQAQLLTTRVSAVLPLASMIESPTLDDLVSFIPSESTRVRLMQILGSHEDSPKLFTVEIGLDAAYYEQLADGAAALARADREVARELVGMDVDISILLWAFRLSQNYGVSSDALVGLLAALGTNVRRSHLSALWQATTDQERIAAVPSVYRKCLPRAGSTDISACEQALYTYLYRVALRYFRRMTSDIAGVVSYYFLKRSELVNLIRVVQAVRYGLPEDAAKAFLISSTDGD